MSDTPNQLPPIHNSLLSELPPDEMTALLPHLEPVSLAPGTLIAQPGDRLNRCYFPNSGMVSLLSVTEQGQTVEVGFTGREGLIGLSVILGPTEKSYQTLVQAKVEGFAVDAKVVKNLFDQCGVFHNRALRYTHVVIKQIAQTCVCNHFHTIEARLCRWLTVMCERANNNHLVLTQEFLAHMLGVQRTSIGLIANNLQKNGIIRYSRGKIEVLDADRLRGSACECYSVVRDEHDKFLREK